LDDVPALCAGSYPVCLFEWIDRFFNQKQLYTKAVWFSGSLFYDCKPRLRTIKNTNRHTWLQQHELQPSTHSFIKGVSAVKSGFVKGLLRVRIGFRGVYLSVPYPNPIRTLSEPYPINEQMLTKKSERQEIFYSRISEYLDWKGRKKSTFPLYRFCKGKSLLIGISGCKAVILLKKIK